MSRVFLIGGGWREYGTALYRRFLDAAVRDGSRSVAVIAANGGDNAAENIVRFREGLVAAGCPPAELVELIVSAESPLTREMLEAANATGILVCGGLTPDYHDSLCVDLGWLGYISDNDIPYCGFSAGASIAAREAVIGGWLRNIDSQNIEIADENAAEDVDLLLVKPGLGLVPFSVEVHATQWGTLTRLLHAVDAGLTDEGYAIDEDTMLEYRDGEISVHGAGSVYHVYRSDGRISLEIKNGDSRQKI
jgi:cyanophycinase